MKKINVTGIQEGKNFITLYFKTSAECLEYATRFYGFFKRNNYFKLQRKYFAHTKMEDVPKFHPEGDPIKLGRKDYHHFHIIYPGKPKKKDWDFIYNWGNRDNLKISKEIKIEISDGEYTE